MTIDVLSGCLTALREHTKNTRRHPHYHLPWFPAQMWIHTLLSVGLLGSFSAWALITSHISRWMWVMTPLSLTWLKLGSNSWHTEAPTGLNLWHNSEYSSAEGLVLASHGGTSTHILLSVENRSPAAGSKLICCWVFEDNESTHTSCVCFWLFVVLRKGISNPDAKKCGLSGAKDSPLHPN